MRILQTCFSPSWGGLEIQALEVTRELEQRGHRLCLACCASSRLHREAERRGIRVVPLHVRGYLHPGAVWSLRRLLVRESIDVVHCQLSKDIALLVPAVRMVRRHIPVLLSKRVGSYLRKRDLLHRFTYAGVSRVLPISSVIHRNVLDTTPIDPARVVTLHDAVDTDRFSPARVDRQRVRSEFGIGEGTVLIGFAGRFSPGKGHEDFLRAAEQLTRLRSGLAFLVVGEASFGEEAYEREIRELCGRLGLGGNVRFAGFRNDMPEVLAAFDILAFPSHAESFGMVLIEAMAMGRPVVSTDCDGVLDIVVDGVTGLFVHPRDPAGLAGALLRLAESPILREQMGTAGRERVLRLFDKKDQIAKLESMYRELCGASGARGSIAREPG